MSECIEKKEYSKPMALGRNSKEVEGIIPLAVAAALAGGLAVGAAVGSIVSSDFRIKNVALNAV